MMEMDSHQTNPDSSQNDMESAQEAFNRLYSLVQYLRGPKGCPWDKEQTGLSMRTQLIEETFEAVDAIVEGNAQHVKEELGDLLFNTLLTSQIYVQDNQFTLSQVMDLVTQKLIRRHPHVFESVPAQDLPNNLVSMVQKEYSQPKSKTLPQQDLDKMWDSIKENQEGRKTQSVLDQIPAQYPPLLKSNKILSKAAKTGFDWPDSKAAASKVQEEFFEVQEAALTHSNNPTAQTASHLEEELGDLLLSTVNWCRKLHVDPTAALARANQKFSRRFRYVEQQINQNPPQDSSQKLTLMEQYWNQAKSTEGNQTDLD